MSAERDDLAAQLAAAERGGTIADGLAAHDLARSRVLTIGFGALTGGLLLLMVYVPVTVSVLGFIAGLLVYFAAVGIVIAWYVRRREAAGRRFGTRYMTGVMGSFALYTAGIVAASVIEARDWWLWGLWAVLVALPGAIIPNLGIRR
jgi:hypothetical protein